MSPRRSSACWRAPTASGARIPRGRSTLLADAVEARGAPRRAASGTRRRGPRRSDRPAPRPGPVRRRGRPRPGASPRRPAGRRRGRILRRRSACWPPASGPRRASASLVRGARAARWLGRMPEGRELADRASSSLAPQGAFGPLPTRSRRPPGSTARAGRWREAYAQASEALELARESRCAWAPTRCLEHLAWLDAAQGTRSAAGPRRRGAGGRDRAQASAAIAAGLALGLLELGLGRGDGGGPRLRRDRPPATLERSPPATSVEALVRGGRTEEARAALERSPGRRADARAARCRGLLARDDDFEAPFAPALDRHAEHDAFGRARTRLCLGERLRRAAAASTPAPSCGPPRGLRPPRRAAVGGARRLRAARHGRATRPPRSPHGRRAHPAGTSGCASRGRGPHEQGDRRRPLPQPQDGRLPPAPRLSQARHAFPRRAHPPLRRHGPAEARDALGVFPNRHRRRPRRSGRLREATTTSLTDHPAMTNSPMSPDELTGWTAQQSARHERTFATTRAARIHHRARRPIPSAEDSSPGAPDDVTTRRRSTARWTSSRQGFRDAYFTPTDPGYDEIRPAFNAMHPGPPAVVVGCRGTADVVDAVNFARDRGLPVAVRGGGHSIAGLSRSTAAC